MTEGVRMVLFRSTRRLKMSDAYILQYIHILRYINSVQYCTVAHLVTVSVTVFFQHPFCQSEL